MRPVRAALCAAVWLATAGLAAQKTGGEQGLMPPRHLWAAQTSPTEVTLAWDRVAGASGYVLYVVDRAGAPRPLATTGVTATATGDHRVTATWMPVPDATAYAIGRQVFPNGYRTLCALCPVEATHRGRSPSRRPRRRSRSGFKTHAGSAFRRTWGRLKPAPAGFKTASRRRRLRP